MGIRLTDEAVRRLSPPEKTAQYIVRDRDLPGFFVVVGRRAKTFTVQYDSRELGRRRTHRKSIGRFGQIPAREARAEAMRLLGAVKTGAEMPSLSRGPTLREAWDRYRTSHLERKGRSERTIEGYEDSLERLLEGWLDTRLAELAERADMVVARHDEITRKHGPYMANATMRALRAVYRHARRTHRRLPPEHPAAGVDWNPEGRRSTGMAASDLPNWFAQLRAIPNPVRREFHLFSLLSGSRPDALRRSQWLHIDVARRVLHFPDPKGGQLRAFDMPLSREMLRCLWRVRRAGRVMWPEHTVTWIFPADTSMGCISETKERRSVLAKWGNDLRQTYRTLAQEAGVGEVDLHLLMNHRLPGANAGYITRGALLDHLCAQQERISRFVMAASSGVRTGSLL